MQGKKKTPHPFFFSPSFSFKKKKMLSEDAYDFLFKIVIIGDSSVGKSNLLLRYTVRKLECNY